MDGDALTRSLQDFLAESPEAVVVEGGEVIFDFTTAKYACNAEHGKCLLHLWSDERNTVRRILDIEVRKSAATATGARPRRKKRRAPATSGCSGACSSTAFPTSPRAD
ncbi:MAG TPA: hypothetical protein VN810_00930 [Terriglobales bacterium]|nr:hypothetical protein [Terriglobales bacterium]